MPTSEPTPSPDRVPATEDGFHELAYLLANPDVAMAVLHGRFPSGHAHFMQHGRFEGRAQLTTAASQADLDRDDLDPDVPMATRASHANRRELLRSLVRPGMKVLEIGARSVTYTGSSFLRELCAANAADYLGLDALPGPNVDLVGDAHRLTRLTGTMFDLVYSEAVFEHLAMPWIVAEEIARSLAVGGFVLVETHFSFGSHERPWHFFQFSDRALRVLFNPALGFECIDCGASNPLVGRFSILADAYLRFRKVPALYCHSSYFGRLARRVGRFRWRDQDVGALTGGTMYPQPRR